MAGPQRDRRPRGRRARSAGRGLQPAWPGGTSTATRGRGFIGCGSVRRCVPRSQPPCRAPPVPSSDDARPDRRRAPSSSTAGRSSASRSGRPCSCRATTSRRRSASTQGRSSRPATPSSCPSRRSRSCRAAPATGGRSTRARSLGSCRRGSTKTTWGRACRSPYAMQYAIELTGAPRMLLAAGRPRRRAAARQEGLVLPRGRPERADDGCRAHDGHRRVLRVLHPGPRRSARARPGRSRPRPATTSRSATSTTSARRGAWPARCRRTAVRLLERSFDDNPLGQTDEQTPIGIWREAPMATGSAAAERLRRVGAVDGMDTSG